MCGSFTQPGDIDIIRDFSAQYGVEVRNSSGDAAIPLQHERTATPFHDVNVIFADNDVIIRLGAMYWQLIYHWNPEFRSKYTAFNTRLESLAKRHNEPLLRRHRCILPARSFFETRQVGGQAVKPRESYEFAFASGALIALGGIFALWVNPADEEDRRYSCSIITLEPNEIIAEVHDRMLLVLTRETTKTWLNPAVTDYDELIDLIQPIDSNRLERSRR